MPTNKRLLLTKKDHWVRPYFAKYKKLLGLVLFLGVLTFFCGSSLMFTSGYLISKSATHPINILLVYIPIVLTRAFGIGRPASRYVERLASHNWVLKMTSDIRLKLYRSVESRAMNAKAEFRSGDILGILAEDIEHIQNLYLRTIFPTIISWLLYIIIVVLFGLFSIPFALMMLLLMGILVFLLPGLSILVNQGKNYRRKEKRHVLYTNLTDSVLGVGDWQYSGRYQEFITTYNTAEAEVRKIDQEMNRYKRKQDLAIQFVFGLIVVALLIWTGHYFYGSKTGLNWIAAFTLAFFPLMDAFAPIAEGVAEVPLYEDSVQRLHRLPKPEKESAAKPIQLKGTGIQFDDVSFQFTEKSKSILHHFNLEIQAGETLAVLGKSGTGKTTLSKLLRGDLEPNSGRITLGAVPISELRTEIFTQIGVLNQSPHLFNTSILNNVRLGNLNASDEEVAEAIKQVGLDQLVASLPQGLNTVVEEGGKRFSGGEQQRIALARILLQNVPVVIIDEPTIGLDPITEKELLQTVFHVLQEKTVLWITHHLLGIEHADRVIFLENGQIEMAGSPQTLRAENQRFQQLYSLDSAE